MISIYLLPVWILPAMQHLNKMLKPVIQNLRTIKYGGFLFYRYTDAKKAPNRMALSLYL